jgi:hypothetical protein
MIAPEWFLRELEAFDPHLRLRWSARRELWQLERKILRGLHPGTIFCDGWHDESIRARDGYILVASIPPDRLTRAVFARLRASDLWSNGGWKRVADQLDAYDEIQEEKSWENFSSNVRDASKDVYEWMKIRDGRTVFNAGWLR